ncbi:DsbA family protein [Microbacterium sp. YY-01]|uniref:DsbA family protein n=1 Tax=Microbacterium sp. YY-01 TaxID=3421634 RepID=UPI003D172829
MSSARPTRSRDRRLIFLLSGALVFVVILLGVALSQPSGNNAAPPAPPTSAPGEQQGADQQGTEPQEPPRLPDLARREANDPAAIGEVDAPVVLVEFADYRCPFCGVFARETLPQIIEEYVDEGLVRVEWHDIPIFGEESFAAAVAAHAAGEQGLFWEYGAAIFAYDGGGHQDLPRERLLEIAKEIGVPDIAAFEAALDSPALGEKVQQQTADAHALGVQSTPTFAVGGVPLMGAQPVEAFRRAIDTELEYLGVPVPAR